MRASSKPIHLVLIVIHLLSELVWRGAAPLILQSQAAASRACCSPTVVELGTRSLGSQASRLAHTRTINNCFETCIYTLLPVHIFQAREPEAAACRTDAVAPRIEAAARRDAAAAAAPAAVGREGAAAAARLDITGGATAISAQ